MSSKNFNSNIVSYSELIAFFLPIALSLMIMMSTHSVVSSALARTTDAAIAIASYSVAKSVSNMFQSPCITLRRLCVARFKSKESFDKVLKLTGITLIISLIAMGVIVFTPLSKFVFLKLIGVSEELLPHTIRAMTILFFMPLLAAVRSIYQGVITVCRKTYLLTIATAVRAVVMFSLAAIITNTQFITGSIIGSVLMISGILTEAVFAFIFGKKYLKQLPQTSPDKDELDFGGLWLFFIPLVVAQFAMTWGQPSVNAGLARAVNPEVSLAAYQVGRSFAWIFIGMFGRVHQLILVFAKNKESWLKVRRFALVLGISQAIILMIIAVTPIGEWILTNIIGVDQELMVMSMSTIFSLSFVPFILSQTEIYAGLLIKNNKTPVITLGKFCNVATLITTVFILQSMVPNMGAAIGGWASVVGYAVELIILFGFSRNVEKQFISDPKKQVV
ncbi:hypothetical protein IMX26_05355 [Clostridium sp. 'deep sea']|uniref:hypothetical protein n=1 Tax=Clostridium sp. 'deep sea' TaxID=2779445 RepID=UPI001896672F|nr:hypothetical protein [Clostridium sp. 'deep sea']QOR36240.1 hypothetical protein IMX26_05355 [Clostridium sp. 'deep sea']